jgi:adenylate kinase
MSKNEPLFQEKSRPYRSILIFGPPGSGKGTQGKFLSSAGNHFHLSSGDIFRSLSPESAAGRLYHSYAHKGHLLPDDVTIGIWHHYVEGLIATNKYFPEHQLLLLDGIPRTGAQVELLKPYIHVEHIIVLESKNLNELMSRMKRRALIERRADDFDEKVVKTRMDVYLKETAQILQHYPEKLISKFNADQKPLEVLRDILVSLSRLLSDTRTGV